MTTQARRASREQDLAELVARFGKGECCRGIAATAETLKQGPPLLANVTLEDDGLSLCLDALKRVDGASKLGEFHYVPMLFHEGRKVGKEQRLLLELYGLLLSHIQGRLPAYGLVFQQPECKVTRVRLNPDVRRSERLIREVKDWTLAKTVPQLGYA